ncbi:MAG: ABC transporter substrate-binding protein [Pseudomonadota bacterium]
MTPRKALFFSMLACVSFLLFPPPKALSADSAPTAFIKSVVDKVFHTLNIYPVAGPAENLPKRRAGIKEIIDENFDSPEMAKRALGKYWRDQSAEKQQEFTKLFYWRLYNFYIMRVETYSDEKVLYKKEMLKGNVASVHTQISSKKYPEFDIEYRVKKTGEGWRIYDVVIEGVSLVANYRSQFGNFLSKKTFEELLKELRSKNPENNLH